MKQLGWECSVGFTFFGWGQVTVFSLKAGTDAEDVVLKGFHFLFAVLSVTFERVYEAPKPEVKDPEVQEPEVQEPKVQEPPEVDSDPLPGVTKAVPDDSSPPTIAVPPVTAATVKRPIPTPVSVP